MSNVDQTWAGFVDTRIEVLNGDGCSEVAILQADADVIAQRSCRPEQKSNEQISFSGSTFRSHTHRHERSDGGKGKMPLHWIFGIFYKM